jgi:hypothetical protein
MSVQSGKEHFLFDEDEPLVHYEVKKQCRYKLSLLMKIFVFLPLSAHMSWIMATGLIINAAMGVSFLSDLVRRILVSTHKQIEIKSIVYI